MLTTLRGSQARQALPKGLTEATLQQVLDSLRDAGAHVSATEVGDRIGVSRVTARRYLEHLVDIGMAERSPQYGGPGRPENRYRLTPATG
jgi:response regulator of citrate/malate metabolism